MPVTRNPISKLQLEQRTYINGDSGSNKVDRESGLTLNFTSLRDDLYLPRAVQLYSTWQVSATEFRCPLSSISVE